MTQEEKNIQKSLFTMKILISFVSLELYELSISKCIKENVKI